MSTKKPEYILTLVAAAIIGIATYALIGLDKPLPPKPQPKVEHKVPANQEILTKWVYNNSKAISHTTAEKIVTTVLKYQYSTLIIAIMEVESEFNPSATSHKGALGLGQIHFPAHGKRLIETKIIKERRDLYDIEMNVRATSLILNSMLQESNYSVAKTLEVYLGGKDGKYVLRILTNFTNLSIQLEKNK